MSTSVDRTTPVRGAGSLTFNSQQFWVEGGIVATIMTEVESEQIDGYGEVDEVKVDEYVDVTANLKGLVAQALLDILFPSAYLNPTIDASIYGASDDALDVHSMLGKKVTLHNAALTEMCNLYLGANKDIFDGQAKFVGIIKNSTARSAAAAVYTIAEEAHSGTPDRTQIKRCSYTGTWDTGVDAVTIIAKEGWQVQFNLEVNMQQTNDLGTYDATIGGMEILAKCTPINLSEAMADYRLVQNDASAPIGSSLRQGKQLEIASDVAGGLTLTLPDAVWKEGPLQWGEDTLRAGEIGFKAMRSGGTGAFATLAITT